MENASGAETTNENTMETEVINGVQETATPQPMKRVSIDKEDNRKKIIDEEEEEEEEGEDLSFLKNRTKSGMLLLVNNKDVQPAKISETAVLSKDTETDVIKLEAEVNMDVGVIEMPKEMEAIEVCQAEVLKKTEENLMELLNAIETKKDVMNSAEAAQQTDNQAEEKLDEKELSPVQMIPVEIVSNVTTDEEQSRQAKPEVNENPVTEEEKVLTQKIINEFIKTVTTESHDLTTTSGGKEMAKQMLNQLENTMTDLMAKAMRTANTSISSKESDLVSSVSETTESVASNATKHNQSEERKSSATMATQTAAEAKLEEKEELIAIPIKIETSTNKQEEIRGTKPMNGFGSDQKTETSSSTVTTPVSMRVTMNPGTVTTKTVQRTETKKTYINKKTLSSTDWIQQKSVSEGNWISGAPWTHALKKSNDQMQMQQPQTTSGIVPNAKEFFQKITTTTRTENFTSDGQSSPKHWVTESKQVVEEGSPQMATAAEQNLQDFNKRFETNQQQMGHTVMGQSQTTKTEKDTQQQRMQTESETTTPAATLEDFKKRFEQPPISAPAGHIRTVYTKQQQWHTHTTDVPVRGAQIVQPEPPPPAATVFHPYQQAEESVRPTVAASAQFDYSYSSQQWKTVENQPIKPDVQIPTMPGATDGMSPFGMMRTTTYQQRSTESQSQRPETNPELTHNSQFLSTGPFGRMPISRTVTSSWTSKVTGQPPTAQQQ